MIEEIIKLRGDGLSFRKIASELNTTVGKIQYRWNKWMASTENDVMNKDIVQIAKDTKSLVSQTSLDFIPLRGELTAKLVTPRKLLLFWEASELPKKITELYFNVRFEKLVTVVRIYDVTALLFNGKNAHHFYEITVPYQHGHWFIKGLDANRNYVAELGVLFSKENFFPLFRSNCIQTPMLEIPNGNVMNHDFEQLQRYEDQPPKWLDHVSTYSYYVESKKPEEENE
ncbi:MAG: DUF4912 domain-containing protein [Bacillus sp. (in: Bacteria)]|nr:DUF4912 domain-containing protein [Bacillus sp. (in: firmicutes)]